MNRPNILLLTTDQQRWDTIHALGNEVIKTSPLDRLVIHVGGGAFASAAAIGFRLMVELWPPAERASSLAVTRSPGQPRSSKPLPRGERQLFP